MSYLKVLKEYSKRGPFDELFTPDIAVEMILPYIPKEVKTIWECTAHKESRIVKVLTDCGYNVITSHIADSKDFFTYEPIEDYQLIVTNPPFSVKDEFLERGFDLKKPFMFLFPITTLAGMKRNKMFRENKIQLLIPDKRFNFKPEKKSGSWFQTSWFTTRLGLENDLNYIQINDKKQHSKISHDNGMSIIDYYNEFRQAA